jgi:hypothetical protein
MKKPLMKAFKKCRVKRPDFLLSKTDYTIRLFAFQQILSILLRFFTSGSCSSDKYKAPMGLGRG